MWSRKSKFSQEDAQCYKNTNIWTRRNKYPAGLGQRSQGNRTSRACGQQPSPTIAPPPPRRNIVSLKRIDNSLWTQRLQKAMTASSPTSHRWILPPWNWSIPFPRCGSETNFALTEKRSYFYVSWIYCCCAISFGMLRFQRNESCRGGGFFSCMFIPPEFLGFKQMASNVSC